MADETIAQQDIPRICVDKEVPVELQVDAADRKSVV